MLARGTVESLLPALRRFGGAPAPAASQDLRLVTNRAPHELANDGPAASRLLNSRLQPFQPDHVAGS